MTKLCKDCVHHSYKKLVVGDESHLCERRMKTKISKVTGQPTRVGLPVYCSVERAFSFLCGEEARYFEEKE